MANKRKIDIEKILKDNPHLNIKEYRNIKKQQKELRALGLKRAGYNLSLPFMRRVSIPD